jgi:tRNA(Ile2) C34 agmatinyltransferase TiaS
MDPIKVQVLEKLRCEKCGGNLYEAIGKNTFVCRNCQTGYKIIIKVEGAKA